MPEVVVKLLHEDNTPLTAEEVEVERQRIIAAGDTPIIPGSSTDSVALLGSLQAERAKVKSLEDKLELLAKGPHASPDVTTPEGLALKHEIDVAKARIEEMTRQGLIKDLYIQYPALREKSSDFEKYLTDPENEGMSLATAAKAYMIENNIQVRRPGMERPTGGDRVPPSTGMTVEDIRILRETNFKKYKELLGKGLIKI